MAHMAYSAPRWLTNRHLMTIYGSVARLPVRLPTVRERWELSDGDFLDVDRLAGARPDAPVVLVCHGLEGSSRAGYVRGVLVELRRAGLSAVALNFRGCSEPNRLARAYHSGDTADLAHAIARLLDERPARALGLVGFSLGGNVITKYLGERGSSVPERVLAAAVVSVPFDLAGCQRALDGPGVPARIYRERFLRKLKRKALDKAERFACIDAEAVRRARTLRAFDGAEHGWGSERSERGTHPRAGTVTAPLHGFRDAADYYERSSSAAFLDGVQRPLLVLQAADDPFVPADTLPLPALRGNPHLQLELSEAGGHVAFVDGLPFWARRYAEARAVEFLVEKLGRA